jgi:hypothetical protein
VQHAERRVHQRADAGDRGNHQPDEHQQAALDALDNASAKAASMLKATCPVQIPGTTEARLEAMDKRLRATVTAMNEVRPALAGFYDSLSDEQKARVNTMGPTQTPKTP